MSTPPKIGHAPSCLYHSQPFATSCTCGSGVAAPLEPSPWDIWRNRCNRGEHTWRGKALTQVQIEDVFEYATAYAAAVSKNLTDKYAEMEAKWMQELLTVSNEIGEARNRILELEKEITALRTAQTAVTGTESHWRGRDAALRETTK